MIVQGLVPDARRPGSTRILVEGRPAWTVPADVVSALTLEVGQVLRGEAIERLDRAADEEGAFRAALRALERRAHGAGELARKLERKGHGTAAIAAAVARLRMLGLLDDLAFARAYILSRTERGRGPFRIRRDLSQLGVDRDAVETALADVLVEGNDPLERPRALIQRRARTLTTLPVDTRKRRLIAFLARRGYRGSDARTLVEEVLKAV